MLHAFCDVSARDTHAHIVKNSVLAALANKNAGRLVLQVLQSPHAFGHML